MQKETVVACFDVLSQDSPMATEKCHRVPQVSRSPAGVRTGTILRTNQQSYRWCLLSWSESYQSAHQTLV